MRLAPGNVGHHFCVGREPHKATSHTVSFGSPSLPCSRARCVHHAASTTLSFQRNKRRSSFAPLLIKIIRQTKPNYVSQCYLLHRVISCEEPAERGVHLPEQWPPSSWGHRVALSSHLCLRLRLWLPCGSHGQLGKGEQSELRLQRRCQLILLRNLLELLQTCSRVKIGLDRINLDSQQ